MKKLVQAALLVSMASTLLTFQTSNAKTIEIAPHTQKIVKQDIQKPSDTDGVYVKQNEMVQMRDNTELATDIYLPSQNSTDLPTLIARTPYGKKDMKTQATYLAQNGYAVVIQDVRGRYDSKGDYYPFKDDGKDGYDTIEWAAKQLWSNGKVGTFGPSALGISQNAAALENPSHLKAMFSLVHTADFFNEAVYRQGVLNQALIQGWLNAQNIYQILRVDPTNFNALNNSYSLLDSNNLMKQFNKLELPLGSFPNLNEKYMPAYQDMLNMNIIDKQNPIWDLYEANNIMDKLDKIHVPVYHVGGFYDIFEAGVLNAFTGLQNNGGMGARGNQKLLMGPWVHQNVGQNPTYLSAKNVEVDLNKEAVRWFDYWLKGIDNNIMKEPAVKYYVTGENKWETSPTWPVKNVKQTNFYFNQEHSGTIKSLNDGSLSTTLPKKNEKPNTYEYDPAHPTKTVGGNNLIIPSGPMDQRPVENKVLTFTSKPMSKEMKIEGPASATLYISSNKLDTDFTVKVTDVDSKGTSTLLEDGIIRAKFRNGQNKVALLQKGKIYQVKINLTAISHVIQKGHRIRIDVASSNYPKFDRNTNTGNSPETDKVFVKALNTLYHDSVHPSYVTLPIVNN
ncbi:CocE/NonD family hydrolase [Bacillus sp. RG28]|uniref:CocE/NonD family hydrolase n=1 Tax=Gottfriedia endophytica TaxID=2820819 RepID=A0A940SKG2_9BACI|nr:CocE/NonD family hydrolase [Gottfriedia endophytica]MBP0725223.1 CocE/NonD family hydrolase [Gottfriedia endophytica]